MRSLSAHAGAMALAWLAAAATARAQEASPATRASEPSTTHRIEVFNGPYRTVHFFGDTLSRGDRGTLRDVERAENEVALTDRLLALRQQYLTDEQKLQSERFRMQERLASVTSGYASGTYPDQVPVVDTNGVLSFAATYVGLPGFPGYRHFPYGYGWGAYGDGGWGYGQPNAPMTGYVGAATQTLALGAIEEGPIKTELARALAAQATPEYRAMALRELNDALARAGQSERLRAALDVPDRGVRPAAAEGAAGAAVEVTLKDGTKVTGTVVREDNDRIIVNTGTRDVEIRKTETTSISRVRGR